MTQDDVSRIEVPDTTAEAYRARREALHAAISDLSAELDALEAETEPDPDRLRVALTRMQETLHQHVEEADAPDGLLTQVLEMAPWAAPRVDRLRDEHDELLDRAEELIGHAEAVDSMDLLIAEARDLCARAAEHRHRGTELLLDTVLLDIPAGD